MAVGLLDRVANQLMGLSSIVAAPFELVVAITFLYQYVLSLIPAFDLAKLIFTD